MTASNVQAKHDEAVKLVTWDITGNNEYSALTSAFYQGMHVTKSLCTFLASACTYLHVIKYAASTFCPDMSSHKSEFILLLEIFCIAELVFLYFVLRDTYLSV